MSIIEPLKLEQSSFRFNFKNKTYAQQWEKSHAHQGLEFLYIHQGRGHIKIENQIYEIKPKSLVLIQPYQPHKINITASEREPYIRTMFVFEPAFVDHFLKPFPSLYSFFRYLYKGILKQPLVSMEYNHNFHTQLHEFDQRLKLVNKHNHREELIIFLITILHNLKDILPQVSEEFLVTKRNSRHVESVMDWIDSNYKTDFLLNKIASTLHLSPYHISHLFKDEMGCTITEYLTVKRLKEASLLLSSTDLSIKTIGRKVGFKSGSYFSHLFKKNIGMTPKQYRLSSKNFFNKDS